MKLPYIVIYTDGSTVPSNPGTGGWGARLEHWESEVTAASAPLSVKEVQGQVPPPVTNNQMELQAVVEAVRRLKKPCHVLLVTDSRTAVAWMWKMPPAGNLLARALHKEYKNLIRAKGHEVTVELIKGHRDNAGNKRADRLAYAAASGKPILEKKKKKGAE